MRKLSQYSWNNLFELMEVCTETLGSEKNFKRFVSFFLKRIFKNHNNEFLHKFQNNLNFVSKNIISHLEFLKVSSKLLHYIMLRSHFSPHSILDSDNEMRHTHERKEREEVALASHYILLLCIQFFKYNNYFEKRVREEKSLPFWPRYARKFYFFIFAKENITSIDESGGRKKRNTYNNERKSIFPHNKI